MALKGDINIEVQGKPYTLRLDINAMCAIEDAESTPTHRARFHEIAARLNVPKGQEDQIEFRTLRLLIWGLLQAHHPDMTLLAAGELLGNLEDGQAAQVMQQLSAHARPDQADVDTLRGGREANPPNARAMTARAGGTGTGSTGPRGGSGSRATRSGG